MRIRQLFLCLMMFWTFVGCSLRGGGGSAPQPLSYSNYIRASEAGNDDLVNDLLNRATELRTGLGFPKDTFAVDRKRGILVAHTADGWGVIERPGMGTKVAGSRILLGWISYEKRGNQWVLTHYMPNAGGSGNHHPPDPRLPVPEQIKHWLAERNYQIKKEVTKIRGVRGVYQDEYHITNNGTRISFDVFDSSNPNIIGGAMSPTKSGATKFVVLRISSTSLSMV